MCAHIYTTSPITINNLEENKQVFVHVFHDRKQFH